MNLTKLLLSVIILIIVIALLSSNQSYKETFLDEYKEWVPEDINSNQSGNDLELNEDNEDNEDNKTNLDGNDETELDKDNSGINTSLVFTKCKKKSAGKVLNNIFTSSNIIRENNTNNWDLYIPCGYNYVEKELKQIKVKNPNQKIFGINGCDSIVSKNRLWELIHKRYGRKIASQIMPETFILNKFSYDFFLV